MLSGIEEARRAAREYIGHGADLIKVDADWHHLTGPKVWRAIALELPPEELPEDRRAPEGFRRVAHAVQRALPLLPKSSCTLGTACANQDNFRFFPRNGWSEGPLRP